MSQGKYSPAFSSIDANRPWEAYCYNADRQIPPELTEMGQGGEVYDTRIYFANYDENGYDNYGYSAFDAEGVYVGPGNGIDRWGATEMDYLGMSEDEYYNA